jgi:hypothetical protein
MVFRAVLDNCKDTNVAVLGDIDKLELAYLLNP